MRQWAEQPFSYNFLCSVPNKRHISSPPSNLFGCPLLNHKDLSTGVPSSHWNWPCSVRPMSDADTQKPLRAAKLNLNLQSLYIFVFISYAIRCFPVLLPPPPLESKFWDWPIASLSLCTNHALCTKSPPCRKTRISPKFRPSSVKSTVRKLTHTISYAKVKMFPSSSKGVSLIDISPCKFLWIIY